MDQEAVLEYDKYKKEFSKWLREQTPSVAEDYLRRLERLIAGKKINEPHELAKIFEHEAKNSKVAIRNFMKFLIEKGYRTKSQLIDFQAVIKIPKSGIREPRKAFTTTDKIKEALEKVKDEKKQLMIKLLAYSGIRLSEAVDLLKTFNPDRLEFKDGFARYELHKLGKTKKAFWAYMPASFARQLKRFPGIKETTFKGEKLADRIILPNMLRKWNVDFLDEHGVKSEIIDFIQGRTPEKILAKHYMDRLKKADEAYSKIVNKFPF
jgi:intergrase/recombinase